MTVRTNISEADSAFDRDKASYASEQAKRPAAPDAKWPLGVRVTIIVGLSVLFWSLIIAGISYVYF